MEALVALTVVGIAAALGLPKMQNVANQNRVHRAAQGFQIEVQQAFAIAGRNRAPVTLRWISTAAELQVTSLTGGTVYRRASLKGYGLKASEATVSPTVLTVFPNGLAAGPLAITIARGTHTKQIQVSRAGMVRVR